MSLFRMTKDKEKMIPIPQTTFAAEEISERKDMQRALREQIEIVAPDTMVLAEEYGDWVDSKRRIDLLGLDKSGNLVVFELKRTEDGGHMELQALRYAAMVSTMTFDQAVEAHRKYLESRGLEEIDPREVISKFLGTEEVADFNSSVRVVLVSADFSKEVTSTVMWLNDQGLDIKCVRVKPYRDEVGVLVYVGQVIPLPEAAEYQVAIQQKSSEKRAVERKARDYTKFRLSVGSKESDPLNKRRFMLQVVKAAVDKGVTLEQIERAIPETASYLYIARPGQLNSAQFAEAAQDERLDRFFVEDDELIHVGDKTYALSNQWGESTEKCARLVISCIPKPHAISYTAIPNGP